MVDDDFYDTLVPDPKFAGLSDPDRFEPVPDSWFVGTTDIVNSTGEIQSGRYKAVNMVGASVISAMMNALEGELFPYVFGGDGASFAVPARRREAAEQTLSILRTWVQAEFGMALRAALTPISDIRAAGLDVRLARYAPSPGIDYAMFAGGGLDWAEQQMKSGAIEIAPSPELISPNLDGLSCRWNNLKPRNGRILSLVVVPASKTAEFEAVADRIVELADGLEQGGHPVPAKGPDLQYPPPGLSLEAHTLDTNRPYWLRKLMLRGRTLVSYLIFRFSIPLGSFDPDHYRAGINRNADFRKYDDGLKMTLDCDATTRDRIIAVLEQAKLQGKIRYGVHEQDEALVTCIVPSALREDHVHFVDGAAGGYTLAAAQLKG
ncbi:MAG: DUF3095 family protein [Rhodobacteraceae bacterium]|nr:DUF3095 family protein [Paracoccaceae bacterium]